MEYSSDEHLAISIVLGILITVGMTSHILLELVVAKNWGSNFHSVGYSLLLSHSFGELLNLLVTACALGISISEGHEPQNVNITETSTASTSVPSNILLYRTLGLLYNITYFSVVGHLIVIATNRLVSVRWPPSYQHLFSSSRFPLLLLCCWSLPFVAVAPQLSGYVYFSYQPNTFSWSYDIIRQHQDWRRGYIIFDTVLGWFTVVWSVTCYSLLLHTLSRVRSRVRYSTTNSSLAIIQQHIPEKLEPPQEVKVEERDSGVQKLSQDQSEPSTNTGSDEFGRKSKRESDIKNERRSHIRKPKGSREEARLGLQFFLITCTYGMGVLFFFLSQWTIGVGGYEMSKWHLLALNLLFIIIYTINPFVYFVFNVRVRRAICQMIRVK